MRLNYPSKVSEEGFQVMVLFLSILKKSFNDFLSARMLLINLGPVLLSLAFFGAVFYYNGTNIVGYCQTLLPQSLNGYSHSQGFFAGVFAWVFKALVYFLVFWIVILLSLVINIFASVFYTPLVVSYLHQKYYPHVVLEEFGSYPFFYQIFFKIAHFYAFMDGGFNAFLFHSLYGGLWGLFFHNPAFSFFQKHHEFGYSQHDF
ncbi:hypothetical protein BTM451_02770 [Helicobacter pylori]